MSSAPSPYTTLSEDTDAVLKLNLGERRGTRRIAFRKLWDPESSSVSYQRLVDLAVQYSISSAQQNESRPRNTKIHRTFSEENAIVNVTYNDEDGDTITISSDEELADAFHQFLSKLPPVRVVRAFAKVRGLNVAKKRICPVSVETMSPVDTVSNTEKEDDIDSVPTEQDHDDITSHQSPPPNQSFLTNGSGKDVVPFKNTPATTHDLRPCAPTIVAPPVSARPAPPSPPKAMPESFSPDFIHGRHTCDGCFTTPIIGYRYTAVNLPDYDLCKKCFNDYKGSEIIFAADQRQRDEHFQQRWKRRFLRHTKYGAMSSPNKVRHESERGQPCEGASAERENSATTGVKTTVDFEAATEKLNTLLDSRNACPKKVNEALRTFEETPRQISGEEKLHSNPPSLISVDTRTNVNAATQVNSCSNLDPTVTCDIGKDKELKTTLRSLPTKKGTDSAETTKVDAETNTENEKFGNEATRIVESTSNEPEIVIEPTEEVPIDTFVMDDTEPQPESQLPSVASQGDIILDGEDEVANVKDNETCSIASSSDGKSQNSSNGGWEVVADNSVVTDEMMAQAAKMLGSALFQSDINVASNGDAETSASALVVSDSVCSAFTSVPTITDSSEISSTLLNRWEDELRQLHELGFMDDRANVEAFGHLEAANMGVDSDDKVTVAQVVGFLLNKK